MGREGLEPSTLGLRDGRQDLGRVRAGWSYTRECRRKKHVPRRSYGAFTTATAVPRTRPSFVHSPTRSTRTQPRRGRHGALRGSTPLWNTTTTPCSLASPPNVVPPPTISSRAAPSTSDAAWRLCAANCSLRIANGITRSRSSPPGNAYGSRAGSAKHRDASPARAERKAWGCSIPRGRAVGFCVRPAAKRRLCVLA